MTSSESKAGNRVLAGSCRCGVVRYEVSDAFVYAANCHCSGCRAATGSAFKAFAGIEREKLTVTEGLEDIVVFGEEDLNDTRCRACGSFLFSVVRDGAWVHVAMGSLVMLPPSVRHTTYSSAPRRPGSRSPTTCRNSTSTRHSRPLRASDILSIMSSGMRAALVRFLDALEAIGAEHEEVYDTDVRERLAAVIEQRLITKPHDVDVPDELGMFSVEGNRLVREALVSYLAEAAPRADALNLDEAARRAAVWDGEAASSNGTPVDEFLGWVD